MGGEQERIRLEPSPTRCPFCHAQIDTGDEAWVACRACLGRHHAACWQEAGRCAGCGLDEHLRAGETGDAPAFSAVPADHAELRRVLEAAQAPGNGVAEWLLSPLTAGLYPLLSAEARFRSHLQANRGAFAAWERSSRSTESADAERLAAWQSESLDGADSASRNRSGALGGAFAVCLGVALVGLVLAATADDDFGIVSILAGWAWGVGLLVGAALHHLGVARHEQRQLCHHLLARGATPEEARAALAAHGQAWRWGVVLTLASGLVAGFASCGIAIPFLYPLLTLWPLRRHELREAEVFHLRPPPK